MSVKDLVKQFEGSSASPEPEGPSRMTSGARRRSMIPKSSSNASSSGEPLPPSPARFIHHPLLQRRHLPLNNVSMPPRRPRTVVQKDAEGTQQRSSSTVAAVMPSLANRLNDEPGSNPTEMNLGESTRPDRAVVHTETEATTKPVNIQEAGGSPNLLTLTQHKSRARVSSKSSEPNRVERSHTTSQTLAFTSQDHSFLYPNNPLPPGPTDGIQGDILRQVSPSQGDRPVSLASTSHTQPSSMRSVKPIPPAYSIFEELSSSKPFNPSSRLQQSQSFNDIPMNMLTRNIHDHNDLTTRPPSPSATLISHGHFAPHVPVAAKTVFSRGSAPLLLPPLDDYLSSLSPPAFSSYPCRNPTSGDVKSSDESIFPPLDRLAATGRTIEDLENNAVIAPWWRNRDTIFGSLVNVVIGSMGSSAIASYYSLQGLYDGFQLFALLLSTVVPHAGMDISDKWRKLFLGTIPNVLALNLSTTLMESFILLVILMAISGLLLYYFHVSTTRIARESSREGLQGKDTGASWGIVFASFTLTLIYLPLSTIAVHALLWSQDFWAVPNPYINATTFPPDIPPLGPSSQFRDPLDFCYTTTMRKNEINFAPALVVLSALTFLFLTIWFPIRLASVIKGAVPRVDLYTEFGKRRSKVELNHEYERLLDRDKNPFNFLYKDLRMQCGTYKSTYLFVKLSTLLIVALLDPENCAFRNSNSNTISIVRQAILVLAMIGFLIVQSVLTPFLDPVNNASEWISRAGYVAFAVLGLATALNLPGELKDALNGPILYIIYIVNYGFTFYFLLINLSLSRRLVKKLFRRIDFSIDIFSPQLDISNTSRHTRRRIWQETISVLLLTSHDCAIPKSQKMEFSDSPQSRWPPYLIDFQGTPAERHVENLKILREVGGLAYAKGIALYTGRCSERMRRVQERIQRHFIGPDSYWKNLSQSDNVVGCFGNAWWIPFPPTLVMRHDSGQLSVLDKLQDLEEYLRQNENAIVQEKRKIRMALRALDGLIVTWPYTHRQQIGSRVPWCWGRRYTAEKTVDYESCVFSIKRRGILSWKGVQLGSGFDVQLTYSHEVHVDGDVIGLDADFDLTPQLAKFLLLNTELINSHVHCIDAVVADYRRQTRRGMRAKRDALTYEFLCTVYGSPKPPHAVEKVIIEQEKDLRARKSCVEHEDALTAAHERMMSVNRSEVTVWWYLYWDDLWRRNHDTISALLTHAADFNPHYLTSIAYRPLPRAALETFLGQRGLFHKKGVHEFIHSGVLNKLYFRLNQIAFRGSDKAIALHLGDASFEVDIENLEFTSHPKTSSLGTGGGTDHDDVSIRARPFYRWEAIYEDPLHHGVGGRHKRWLPKLAVWFGLSPYWKSGRSLTNGVSLDVQLEDGKYVLLEGAVDELKNKVD